MMTVRTGMLAAVLLGTSALLPAAAWADEAPSDAATAPAPLLDQQFQDPPQSARPRVWWHWMNGNVTKDGISKDLAWMRRVGIGGLQNFDANLQTPQVVDNRLVYMTPEWKDAFRFAATEADRLGLELAIASSPGWSETGGPWVKPADGLKKLVWTQTDLTTDRRAKVRLPQPANVVGPFQGLGPALSIEELITGKRPEVGPAYYADVSVIAYPVSIAPRLPDSTAAAAVGGALDVAALSDSNLGEGVVLERKEGQPLGIVTTFEKPAMVRSATVFVPSASIPFVGTTLAGVLESSDDGLAWAKIADVTLGPVPTTVSFAPRTTRKVRLLLVPAAPLPSLGQSAPGAAQNDIFGGAVTALLARPVVVGTFALYGEPKVDRFETKAGFVMSRDYYALPGPDDSAAGVSHDQVVDVTAHMMPDGTLDWTPPKLPRGQQWRVVRFGYSLLGTTNHPATPEATGLEVDKYDGPAVRAYLEHYLGMYRDAAGADMIGKRGVRALLTDSIEVGEANWTPKMFEQFQRLRGYDARPWLPALTGQLVGSRQESDKFLYDYRRTLADLLASEHYGTVAKVAHENDLIVYGEALEDRRPMLGDDMAMRSHADIPMAALWTYGEEGPRASLLADLKGAASVAHIYGRRYVAAESMTSAMSPWAFAPKDLKRVMDLEFLSGINRPVIHTSVHVPVDEKKPGLSLFIFGQYFNRNESWAELAKPWIDYMARSSLLLQQGRNVADVAYFHGEEAPLTSLYGESPVADAPKTYAYDFLNFDALTGMVSNDGADVVTDGGARYKAIYLGGTSRMMTLAALRKLAGLVEGGATVVGSAPIGDPGLSGEAGEFAKLVAKLWPGSESATVGKGRVIAANDIEAALRTLGVASDFTFAGEGIPFVHRRDGDADIYFFVNQQTAVRSGEARFRVSGKQPELWHAETGSSETLSYRIEGGVTIVPLDLQPGEAVFVVFRKPAVQAMLTVAKAQAVALATLDDSWIVAFQPDRGAPASIKMSKISPLDSSNIGGIKYFSGIATYSRNLALPKDWRPGEPLWLDLGDVGDLAQVSINGIDVGTAWHAPYRLDISKAVRKGQNRLEIKVANTWVNRLIGDAQPGAKPITWTAIPTFRADAPLRPSGLLGPVRLLGIKR